MGMNESTDRVGVSLQILTLLSSFQLYLNTACSLSAAVPVTIEWGQKDICIKL